MILQHMYTHAGAHTRKQAQAQDKSNNSNLNYISHKSIEPELTFWLVRRNVVVISSPKQTSYRWMHASATYASHAMKTISNLIMRLFNWFI